MRVTLPSLAPPGEPPEEPQPAITPPCAADPLGQPGLAATERVAGAPTDRWPHLVRVQLTLAVALSAMAGWMFSTAFSGWQLALGVILASFMGAGVVVLFHALGPDRADTRSPAAGTVLSTLMPWAQLVIHVACWLGLSSALTTKNPWDVATFGVRRLFASNLPLSGESPGLGLALGVVWLSAALAAVAVLSRRGALFPPTPPLVTVLVALLLGASGSNPKVLPAAGFVVIAAALVAAGHSATEAAHTVELAATASRTGTVTGGWTRHGKDKVRRSVVNPRAVVAVLAVVTMAGAAVGLAAPLRREVRWDLHKSIVPPEPPSHGVTPMAAMAKLLNGQPQVLYTAQVQVPTGFRPNWRMVEMEVYDGQAWRSDARLREAGDRLAPDARRTVASVEAAQRVVPHVGESLYRYLPPALPTFDRPSRLTTTPTLRLLASEPDGALMLPGNTPPPREYIVVSELPAAGVEDYLKASTVAAPPEQTNAFPPFVREAALTVSGNGRSPFEKLSQMSTYFRQPQFALAKQGEARSGHNLAAIEAILTEEQGRRVVATTEQYSAAFAVLARSLGFRSRVVFGFRWKQPDANGIVSLTSADVIAWPEVLFQNLGWVPFEPYPTVSAGASPSPSATTTTMSGQQSDGLEKAIKQAGDPKPKTEDTMPPPPWRFPWRAAALVALVVVIVGLVGWMTFIVTTRRRRTSARRRGPPRARAQGAWREALEMLSLHSIPTSTAMSADEVRSVAEVWADGDRAVVDPLNRLGQLANLARFAPMEQGDELGVESGEEFGPELGDEAWLAVDKLRTALDARVSSWQRLTQFFSSAPLRWDRTEERIRSSPPVIHKPTLAVGQEQAKRGNVSFEV